LKVLQTGKWKWLETPAKLQLEKISILIIPNQILGLVLMVKNIMSIIVMGNMLQKRCRSQKKCQSEAAHSSLAVELELVVAVVMVVAMIAVIMAW
jgi:hypothetical protein